jgi:hypothetical protein
MICLIRGIVLHLSKEGTMLNKVPVKIVLLLELVSIASGCKSHTWKGDTTSPTSDGGFVSSLANGRDPSSTPSGTDFYPSSEIGPVNGKK